MHERSMQMDAEQAWQDFKKSNQTSVEDKLDVILAQQQEILTDTSRVADLVPLVTGDKAEEDAIAEDPALAQEEMPAEDGMAEEPVMDGAEMGEPADGESDMGADADNPFAFLDEEPDIQGESEEEAYEDTDGESDIVGEEQAEADYEADDGESDVSEDYSDEEVSDYTETPIDSDEEQPDGETAEGEEESADDEYTPPSEDEYIPFEELDDSDEETKKAYRPTAKAEGRPLTRTIRKMGDRTPYTIVSHVQKPSPSHSFGRASDAESISDMLFKSQSSDFNIGFGVDPHEETAGDWAMYRMMKRLNSFREG